MNLSDFVMLGRTVPEESKRHGLVACSAGYSRELRQFMRIYPLGVRERFPRWSVAEINVRRNPHDSRVESWRIDEDKGTRITGSTSKDLEFDFLASKSATSIKELNDQRLSLGIVSPKITGWRFDKLKQHEEFMRDLFGDDEPKRTEKPRLLFDDAHGSHDLQIRDWGAFEFLRKNELSEHGKLWSALKLTDETYEHLLFVGNHAQHRNSWLIIAIISCRTNPQLALF